MEHITFDNIRHTDENGKEFWLARELQEVLQYAQWRRFEETIARAKISCDISKQDVSYHFANVGKTITMPKGASKIVTDFKLTRYACYLIVMNGDPRKEIIALGQTYFAVKTRQQELEELYPLLSEDGRRLFLRSDVRQKNMLLSEAANRAGIKTGFEYADFMNSGYKGLYGGMTAQDIADKKNLKPGEEILDYMGSAELGANLFRITQTEDILRKNDVTDKVQAGKTHYTVGKRIRETIADLGGTMPEDLPTPEKSAKELETDRMNALKGGKFEE